MRCPPARRCGEGQQPLAFPVRLVQVGQTGRGTIATSKKRCMGAISIMQCQNMLHTEVLPARARPTLPRAERAAASTCPTPRARNAL